MKVMMMLAVSVLTLSPLASAAASPVIAPAPSCQEEVWNPLGQNTKVLTSCVAGESLQRARTTKKFPKLGALEYPVEFWQGSYGRTIVVTEYYARRLVDHCKSTTADLGQISVPRRKTVEFKIDNPNLNDDVAASYQLVPMTAEEAAAALDRAKQECESWTPAQ